MAEGGILGLVFEIAADPTKAQAAMEELKASTVAESTEISNIWSGAMNAIAGPTGIALGSIAGLGGSMFEMAHHASEAGAEIYEAAKKTSLSAEELSGLRVTANELGESFQGLSMSLGRFGVNIQRGLQDPSNAAGKDLRELMGSAQAVEKLGLMPMDQRVQAVTKALFAMKDESERNRIAADLFGRAWQTNFETFEKLGIEGFDPMIQKAKDLHQMYGPERAAEAKEFTEKWNDLKQTFSGLADTIGSALMPAFTKLFAGFAGTDSPMGQLAANWMRVNDQVEKFGYALDDQGKFWTKEDLAQRKAVQTSEEWHAATATSVEDLKKMTDGLSLAGMSFNGISVHLAGATKAATGDASGTGSGGAAGGIRKIGDAAHFTYPHLKTVDDELRSIVAANYASKLHGIAEVLLAISGGTAGAALSGKAPGGQAADPFGQMAKSLQQAIVPLDNFTAKFKILASIQPQVMTEQQRIITNLKLMAMGWAENGPPLMKQIQEFGLADTAFNQFVNTAYQGLQKMAQAMGQAAANAIVYGQNFGKSMEAAAKSTVASIASQAFTQAIYATGLGFLDLALGDATDAALAFEAAGVFALIGGRRRCGDSRRRRGGGRLGRLGRRRHFTRRAEYH